MLTVIQFPIADFRLLIDAGLSCRQPTPSWSRVNLLPPQFVRSFGDARRRSRATDLAWVDEASFFNAARALRLSGPLQGKGPLRHVTCAFRRLLHDDTALARVEVGFGLLRQGAQDRLWNARDVELASGGSADRARAKLGMEEVPPLDLLLHTLNLRAVVPSAAGRGGGTEAASPRPLLRQGRHLSRLLFHATCPLEVRAAHSEGAEWNQYVAPASPVAVVECADKWFETLPTSFAEVRQARPTARVAYGELQTSLGRLGTWVVGCDSASSSLVRNLRTCLLRLHAEQQVLALVLDRAHTGALPFTAGTPAGDLFESYLNKSTHNINRENWDKEIKQSELLAAFDAVQTVHGPVCRALATQLEGVRLQVKRKVERFLARAQGITIETLEGDLNMGDTQNISISNSNVHDVNFSNHVEDSLVSLQKSGVNEDILNLLRALYKQVNDISRRAPPRMTDPLQESTVELVAEMAKQAPQRKACENWVERLKKSAKDLGEIGTPILETAGKLLPLLVKFWP